MSDILTLEAPSETARRIASKWVMAGGEEFEVFTLDGVEYVKGDPADVVVILTNFGGKRFPLRRRDSVARANALCSIHKAYRAIRRPRTSCPQCHEAYDRRHGGAES